MKQQPAQTKDAFLQQLEMQAKVCNFQAVTAKENKTNTREMLSLIVPRLRQYDDTY